MKAINVGVAIFLAVAFLVVLINANFNLSSGTLNTSDFLRIHIRANSNSEEDQAIKYAIKNNIVDALTPLIAESESKDDAINIISNNLNLIETVANNFLAQSGFNYSSKASINSEYFPLRQYDDYVLDSGLYDALILNLGTGLGDNWWCVVYPPLCFVNESSGTNIVYRSKILEIIKNFFK